MQLSNLAFVFPGQGSQSIGMLNELASVFPEVNDIFQQASDVLNIDLWSILTHDSAQQLNQTHYTQPIMLAAGVAVWTIWTKHTDLRPGMMAGHSLGEYTALVCAEALSFRDAIALVSERGKLMQQAVPEGVGKMAAIIGLDDAAVILACNEASADTFVSAANFNAPGQVVIAGHKDAVERAMNIAKEKGAKRVIAIPVSVPSHCLLMHNAAQHLAQQLSHITISTPTIKLIHNSDAALHDSPDSIKRSVTEQLFKPVLWVDTITAMSAQGINTFIECGPGKILLGLNKRINKEAFHGAIYDSETLKAIMEHINV
ncbi:MAG: [acyl-carrier-protein] S-malonyltransferase [Methylococcaceae bacterium]|nr:MAG: [acyl-carrier-protein] S-malonyltransferase [Methylococcaceae bacterium]